MTVPFEAVAPEGALGPYSAATIAGGFVFVSGQGSLSNGVVVEGTAREQTELALQNLRRVLARVNCTLADVVHVRVFLLDMADFPSMNSVYEQHFAAPYPARAAVAVRDIPAGLKVEIECVAVASGDGRKLQIGRPEGKT